MELPRDCDLDQTAPGNREPVGIKYFDSFAARADVRSCAKLMTDILSPVATLGRSILQKMSKWELEEPHQLDGFRSMFLMHFSREFPM